MLEQIETFEETLMQAICDWYFKRNYDAITRKELYQKRQKFLRISGFVALIFYLVFILCMTIQVGPGKLFFYLLHFQDYIGIEDGGTWGEIAGMIYMPLMVAVAFVLQEFIMSIAVYIHKFFQLQMKVCSRIMIVMSAFLPGIGFIITVVCTLIMSIALPFVTFLPLFLVLVVVFVPFFPVFFGIQELIIQYKINQMKIEE